MFLEMEIFFCVKNSKNITIFVSFERQEENRKVHSPVNISNKPSKKSVLDCFIEKTILRSGKKLS